MVDVLTQTQRKLVMSRNRNKNTTPEMLLRLATWRAGCRYRIQTKTFGKPDFQFSKAKIAVFVDGCFWHGCPTHYVSPQTRSEFWKTKIEKNRTRDFIVNEHLGAEGWTVLRFWEHDVRKNLDGCVAQIAHALGRPMLEIANS